MSIITVSPVSLTDDGQWLSGGTLFGPYSTSDNFARVGTEADSCWIRFPSVSIERGEIIYNAFLRCYASRSLSTTTVNARIYCNCIDNVSSVPANWSAADALVLTTSYVDWSDIPAWTKDSAYDTPDLSPIITEVVGRAGWQSGNALMIVTRNNGSTAAAGRSAYSVDAKADPGNFPNAIIPVLTINAGPFLTKTTMIR